MTRAGLSNQKKSLAAMQSERGDPVTAPGADPAHTRCSYTVEFFFWVFSLLQWPWAASLVRMFQCERSGGLSRQMGAPLSSGTPPPAVPGLRLARVTAFLEPHIWARPRPTQSVQTWMMSIRLASMADKEIIKQPVHIACHPKRKSILDIG